MITLFGGYELVRRTQDLRPLLVHVDKAVLVSEAPLADDSIGLALDDRIPEHNLILGLKSKNERLPVRSLLHQHPEP